MPPNNSNALLRRFVFGPGVDEPLVWYEGTGTGDRRYLVGDERGSIVAVTNGAGGASGSGFGLNTYDEYGTPGPSNLGRFQYTGQAWLPEAQLYHYKARAYAPSLGRFLQTDPIGFGGGMNLYAYVGNDPVNASDPSGLQEEDEPIIVRACRNGESLANHCQPLPPAWARVVSVNNFLENWLGQNDGGRQLEALMAAMAARIAAMERRTPRRRRETNQLRLPSICPVIDVEGSLGFQAGLDIRLPFGGLGFSADAGTYRLGGSLYRGRAFSPNGNYTLTQGVTANGSIGLGNHTPTSLSGEISAVREVPAYFGDAPTWDPAYQDIFDQPFASPNSPPFVGIDVSAALGAGGQVRIGYELPSGGSGCG